MPEGRSALLLGKYRPIHGDWVAAAMLLVAQRDLPAQTFESPQIRALIQPAATR